MNDCETQGTVGILSVGALGVGFFYYLTQKLDVMEGPVRFIERSGSATKQVGRGGGALLIATPEGIRHVATESVCRPGLLACAESDWLPEILLVCTQSDQILSVITNYVQLLESLFASMELEAAIRRLPLLVLCSNGIYHQRVRRFLVETLEESTLYGRLPDLWSENMGRVVGKLLRGVTMQTARREGHGPDAVYVPGPPGLTRLAGGELAHRRRSGEVLHGLGGNFEVEENESPTRVEFDKALVNLFANLLGQFKAIDEEGNFHPLKVREILPESGSAEARELAHHVIAVGRAVRAYRPDEDFETLYEAAMTVVRRAWEHIPSSIKWIEAQLEAGTLKAQITPTEKWLLEPLIHYASTAGLDDSAHYFTQLVQRVEARLAKAIQLRAGLHSL